VKNNAIRSQTLSGANRCALFPYEKPRCALTFAIILIAEEASADPARKVKT
jgi:hypothetical protein